MKQSKHDKQVIKDEADATKRHEQSTPTGAPNDAEYKPTGATGATSVEDFDTWSEPAQERSWFDRTFRNSGGN